MCTSAGRSPNTRRSSPRSSTRPPRPCCAGWWGRRCRAWRRSTSTSSPFAAQLALSMHVRRRIRRLDPSLDVLHVYSVNAGLALTDQLRAVPSVVSTDSTNELNVYSLPYRSATRWTATALAPTRVLERRVYDAATLVVAQSEWVANSLRDDYGVPDERLRLIPPGLTVPDVIEGRPGGDLPEVTFIGSSMARKGGYRLLEIYRRALRGRAILNLVTLEDVPPEAGVRVFRDLRPGDPRLVELLGGTAVFAFPSEIDKSSYAVLEAMACGVPVVTNRVGALAELVADGVGGRVVEAGDDDAFTGALVDLLVDEGERRRLGEGARSRVLTHFDARVTTAQLIDVLHEARQRRGITEPRVTPSAADVSPPADRGAERPHRPAHRRRPHWYQRETAERAARTRRRG